MKIAVLIAIAEYSDPELGQAPYAANDAQTLARVLEQHGFEAVDRVLLVDSQATKTIIESRLRKALARLQADDTLLFFFAGHSFTSGEQAYLACHDTQHEDAVDTSVALAPLLETLRKASYEQAWLLLDCHDHELLAADAGGEIAESVVDNELREFAENDERVVCFASCSAGEASHGSNKLKHGVWAFHLIEALNADAPLALDKGLVTANSLQNYLQTEMPRTLRATFADDREQTPWMQSAAPDAPLADPRPIIAQRNETSTGANSLITELAFTHKRVVQVKDLSGFKKGHRIPDNVNAASEAFVEQLAAEELTADLDAIFKGLKQAFKFTRRDLNASEPADGLGTISTPFFTYSVRVALDPEDPTQVIWTRTIEAIKAPDQIVSTAFASVFDSVFDKLELSLPNKVNVADLIDAFEAADADDLRIDYDREATYCDLHIAGATGSVRLTADSLSIVHDRPQATRILIQSFDSVKRLIDRQDAPLLSLLPRK